MLKYKVWSCKVQIKKGGALKDGMDGNAMGAFTTAELNSALKRKIIKKSLGIKCNLCDWSK